jgi:hypothetical protein
MAAPTNAANVKKALANSEPSTHGTSRPSLRRNNLVAIGAKRTWFGTDAEYIGCDRPGADIEVA